MQRIPRFRGGNHNPYGEDEEPYHRRTFRCVWCGRPLGVFKSRFCNECGLRQPLMDQSDEMYRRCFRCNVILKRSFNFCYNCPERLRGADVVAQWQAGVEAGLANFDPELIQVVPAVQQLPAAPAPQAAAPQEAPPQVAAPPAAAPPAAAPPAAAPQAAAPQAMDEDDILLLHI